MGGCFVTLVGKENESSRKQMVANRVAGGNKLNEHV